MGFIPVIHRVLTGEMPPLPTELLTSKLFIPPLRLNLVPRPRLIQLLNEGLHMKRRVTLISAPAGSGKTTLVAAWLKQTDHPAIWLSLDEADNDLPRFLAYLAAAFQQIDEQIGAPLLSALQSPQLPAIEKVLTALLNEIALRIDQLILVLDDYHLLGEAAISKVMGFLIDHQPAQLHLVLITREDPALPLARLRARDQLTEIRARNLRFTQEETDAFLREVMGLELSAQDLAALEDRTEGWVVGLQLAGLSMQRQADLKSFIADFSGSQRHILDYLTDEVIRQQPESIRSFLLQTAILDRLSGPLCDAVTGRIDGGKLLAHLEAANLFVIPLDEERRWYRYHHLFSDLLRSQLARSQPELIPELHRRASSWYEENGDIQAAVEHALQDSDLTRAAQLIEQQAITKLYQGEVTMVLGWFDRLPAEHPERAPMMCIYKAWALVLMQRAARTGEVERALQAAEHALDRVNAGEALRDLVAGHAASIQAFLLQTPTMMGENPERLIALSREAQRLLPEDEKAIRSVNALNIGYGYLALADLQAAELAYKQSLEDGLAGGNFYAAIYGPINLGMIALLTGRLKEALQLCDTYIERFNKILAGQNFPPIGALDILKGSILLEYNRLAEVEPVLMEGLDLIRWTGEYEAYNTGYSALARLRAIQGDRPAMLEAVKTLEEAWPEGVFYAQALRHCLSIRYWPGDPQVQEGAQTWWAQSGIEFEKLAVIHSVDPMSMVYFECYLGAAHVLARLAKGKPGAYPLEDAHSYLRRQQDFAAAHEFASLVVEIAIARTLLYQVAGRKDEALKMLEVALRAAAPTGLFRIFLDECEPLPTLLEELKPRLTDEVLIAYANRLLEAFSCGPAKTERVEEHEALLSERELEVLRFLARGLTYEEAGQQLFLSLNTVQFHVKNIYRKLLVNKRVQAIEKAREMNLI
jgi:LuxR family transcriptional regulator, maltose regulon positive regulatory protein